MTFPSSLHRSPSELEKGEEGKWFAAAKDAKMAKVFREAIELASRTPCDPRTLTRAARDYGTTEPAFEVEAANRVGASHPKGRLDQDSN
jgi:hypothetical protein